MSTEAGIGTIFLFQNQTTDANSTSYPIPYGSNTAVIKAWGTFGSATVKLQTMAPQTSPAVWIDVPDFNGNTVAFTTNSQRTMQFIVQNELVRAVLSGSTGTTTVFVSIEVV